MAIKTTVQATIPEVEIKYLQFNNFNMQISQQPPYKISISANITKYGKNADGVHRYEPNSHDIRISDLYPWIGGLSPENQQKAALALQKIEEGLGELSERYLGFTFEAFEL